MLKVDVWGEFSLYGKGEDNILGQEKVILLAGEVVHGSGEFDWMGQEKMTR